MYESAISIILNDDDSAGFPWGSIYIFFPFAEAERKVAAVVG